VLYVLNEEGRLIQWNGRAEDVSGYSADELARLDIFDLFPAEERTSAAEALTRVLREGASELDATIVTKTGDRRHYLLTGRKATLGGKTRVVGVGIDSSDRVRAREEEARLRRALTRAAAEWRQTFDAMEAGILILDERWRVLRLNRSAMEWARRPFAECVDRHLSEFGGEEPWPTLGDMESEMRRRRAAFRQVRNARDGHSWDLAATRISAEREEPRTLLLIRDVTTVVNLQESVRQAEQMAAMGTLTAGVAHEVRNPLFAISANVDALEMVLEGRDDVAELVKAVKDQVRRLSNLMVDLLELGRPSTTALAEGLLNKVVDDAVGRCAGLADRASVHLQNRAGSAPHTVLMDRDRLTQVLDNLLLNAVQHSPRDGVVTVELVPFREDDRPWVRCVVQDTGPGFRPEDLGRVFEPFFSRRRGGTGLGLSIAHRIVEQHAGRLRVRNREGGGAAVSMELPVVGARGAAGCTREALDP
jgi:PAS domain S-box-containing protein